MNIQDILNLLHIDVIAEEVDEPHRMIREAFRVPRYVANDYEDCLRIMVGYYQYHFAECMDSDVVKPYEYALSDVKKLLSKKGGYVLAVKNATRGREGALVVAIDAIAETFREQATEEYIDGVLTHYVNPLDFELRMQWAEEYINQYAIHVLPYEDILSPAELANNLAEVVKYHLKWITSYRNVVT